MMHGTLTGSTMRSVITVFIITAFVTHSVQAYSRIVFHTLEALAYARIDPIIAPGKISQHVHRIVGASGFGKTYDPVKIRKSKCTSLGVGADMSNYWQPAIYRVLDDGSYIGMKTNVRIYYEQPELARGAKVEPFPFDFQMVSGSPTRKSWDFYNQEHISIFYFCQIKNKNGSIKKEYSTPSFPKEACDLLISKVFFPTCWNEGKFKLGGTPHVVFPKFGGGWKGPNCPRGYERRLPGILMEIYHFDANKPATKSSNKHQYILANGDTTGYGLHADFANGWNTEVLQQMISKCKNVPVEEPPNKACAALAPSYNRRRGDDCVLEGVIPNEKVGAANSKPVKYLPGCNLPWASGAKPSCNSTVFKGDPDWTRQAINAYWP